VRTGSKVVCVDDRFPPDIILYYNALPIKDREYRIRGIGIGISTSGEAGEVVVYLEGMTNPCSTTPPHPERGFAYADQSERAGRKPSFFVSLLLLLLLLL